MSTTDAGTDLRDCYPEWTHWLMTAIAGGFAALTLLHGGPVSLPVAATVLGSVLPFLIVAVGIDLSPLVFGMAAIAPLFVLNVAGGALGWADLGADGHTQASLFIVTVVVGEVAAIGRRRDVAVVTAAGLATVVGRWLAEPTFHPWVFWAGGTLFALAIGLIMRRQQEMVGELRDAQAVRAREAVLEERQRVAREVHDVIAHSLTVTMMHLTAARMALRRDPVEAEEALAEAERLGRQSLADIRRTVGLLRSEDDLATDPPQPEARDIPELVAAYASGGMDVQLDLVGDPADLTPSTGLALYRIVQESLANAAKHASGAPVRVRLAVAGTGVDLSVENPTKVGVQSGPTGAPQGSGMGLVGMRERVALLDGTLEAGPTADGWRVRCRFPRVSDASPLGSGA